MTLDKLAEMIQNNLPKKEDLAAVKKELGDKIEDLDHKANALDNKFDALEHTIHEEFKQVRELS